MNFEDKVVLITGGSRGIGFAAAKEFSLLGAKVIIASLNEEPGRLKSDEICASFIKTNVAEEKECKKAVEFAIGMHGKLDILVNSAGVIYRNKTAENTSLEEWDNTFNINVKGTFLMTKYSIPELRKTKGTIVNVSSYVGLVGFEGASAYAASKAAIINFTRSVALDHAKEGIRVNAVCPGSVATDMIESAWINYGDYEKAKNLWESKHPMGRIAQPEEIANVILFLAGSDSGFITGAAIPVDGGITAG